MTSLAEKAWNMLPSMRPWRTQTASAPATETRRGWFGWGGTTVSTTPTDGIDPVSNASAAPAATTDKATSMQEKPSQTVTAATAAPRQKPETGTAPTETPTTPAPTTSWWSGRPKKPEPMFYDDRRWLNPGWLFTSHRAVNKQADWGSLTTEQKDKLSALYDDYRSSKKPAPWDFARSASEYLTDTERANRFYAETIFERGVPKELTTLSSKDYDVAQRLIDAARYVGTKETSAWADKTQIPVLRHRVERLEQQALESTAHSVARTTRSASDETPGLRKEFTALQDKFDILLGRFEQLISRMSAPGEPRGVTTAGQSSPSKFVPSTVRFEFGAPDEHGTAPTKGSGTSPTAH